MKGDGGAIAMLTTTAAVYAGVNHIINEQFLASQFNQQNGQWPTFGEAYRKGKNLTYLEVPDFGTLINNRRFILLGDPALQPCFPKFFVHTDSVIDMATNQATDSFKALGGYTVSGSVADLSHQTMENFNGRVYVTIYDKPRVVSLNTKVYGTPRSYKVQDNIIYKGIANVDNGRFNFSFIAPKDINYAYGRGKISYYAENGSTDAAGIDTGQTVGGFSDKPVTDNDGPIVKPYMNDTLFRNGAVTGANTTLYVQLSDETGINASGNSVGHDITAILDGKTSAPNTLNDYYVTEPNTYKKGHLNFPMAGLSNGRHTITVTAWDVNNNSGEGTVNFEVADGKIIAIQNLMNYPNPFSDVTHFIFEHNHPDEAYKVQIAIYSTDGRQMKMIEQSFTPSGSHSNEITWDGTDNKGAKLPTGVYPYKMVLSTANGIEAAAYQKLVLIR